MRLAQAKGLGKIDIQDRKEPIALIDEGASHARVAPTSLIDDRR
jgi:hypothetical protein